MNVSGLIYIYSAGEKVLPTVDIMSTIEENHCGHLYSMVDIFALNE